MNTITSSVTAKVLALILVVFFSVGGCGGSGDDDDESKDIFVILENPAGNERVIHLLSPGESLSPDNRLFQGQNREVFIGAVMEGERIRFRAGREGVICMEVSCIPDLAQDFFLVSWFEADFGIDGTLTDLFCIDGFVPNSRQIIFQDFCPGAIPPL